MIPQNTTRMTQAVALALALGLGTQARAAEDELALVTKAVEEALQRHAGDAHRCLEKAVADTLDAAGKVQIEVTMAAAGKVKKARLVSKADTVTQALADCIVAAAAGWRIDSIEAGAQLVLPINFSGMAQQFVIKADDAPERGPKARGKAKPPFSVRILADADNVRARTIAVTLLTVGASNRVAMTRHPTSDKVLYVLDGRVRILGPTGMEPITLMPDQAVFIPRGYPHVIENSGRQNTVTMLQIFSPPGPEKVYRDPTDPAARTAFEVVRDAKVKAPEGPVPVSAIAADVPEISALQGKMKVRILLDKAATGSDSMAVSLIEFAPGTNIAPHTHDTSAEFMYLRTGGGTLSVGAEKVAIGAGDAIHIPRGQPHGGQIGGERMVGIQIYAPAGPEQRWKVAPK